MPALIGGLVSCGQPRSTCRCIRTTAGFRPFPPHHACPAALLTRRAAVQVTRGYLDAAPSAASTRPVLPTEAIGTPLLAEHYHGAAEAVLQSTGAHDSGAVQRAGRRQRAPLGLVSGWDCERWGWPGRSGPPTAAPHLACSRFGATVWEILGKALLTHVGS